MKGIPNNQSLGNDELTKEFYETLWYELKDSLMNSIKSAYRKKGIRHFSTSSSYQINQKNNCEKTLLKNCRPISTITADIEK